MLLIKNFHVRAVLVTVSIDSCQSDPLDPAGHLLA